MPYPPGTSRRDLVRGGIIEPHDHECEFHPDEQQNPVIEDGAAIFHEQCIYVEGEYGEGWSCDRTRTYRFEYSTLESPWGEEWELPTIGEWDDLDTSVKPAQQVVNIEERFHNGDEDVRIDVDPDPETGQVTLTYCGWQLHFRP